jgi:AraC-like DNA-binding protein
VLVGYVERVPVPALRDVVRTVWVQRIGAGPYVQRNLPTGGIELHCPIGAVPTLVGPLNRSAVEVLAPGTTVVGVRFWPGGAAAVLGVPAAEFVDLTVDLGDVWGGTAVELGEALFAAASPEHALDVLQRRLVSLRTRDADPLVADMVARLMPWRTTDVGALPGLLNLSESQLRRRCLAALGIGPKTLQRTLRFQGFLAMAQAGGGVLASLAVEAGYADQAHLTRECRRLTGLPPRAFLDDSLSRCACGHDHSASVTSMLGAR